LGGLYFDTFFSSRTIWLACISQDGLRLEAELCLPWSINP
jgi:hypothetical protein